MVIKFSVGNYRSIHHVQELNFRAASLVSENREVDQRNIIVEGDNRVLKTIGIYGANASGKSNIVRALSFFKDLVTFSLTRDEIIPTRTNTFKQASENMDHSGFFELILLIEGKKFRYGFTIAEKIQIGSEWLFGPAETNETYYFTRKDGKISVNPLWFQEGDGLPSDKLRPDALYLSFCASFNGILSTNIKNFITNYIDVDPSLSKNRLLYRRASRSPRTDKLIEEGKKEIILTWLKDAGLLYNDVQLTKIEVATDLIRNIVSLTKNIYDDNGSILGKTEMNLNEDESEGTIKYYSYIGELYRKFNEGGLFISDEIDSNFHPFLLKRIISYFNDPAINKGNAQLLFTSHDTNLMSPDIMRRDQFYFTEKSLMEETNLYSLSDLKGIRNNANFAKEYLAGVYGALPVLGNYLDNKDSDNQDDNP